MLAAATLYFGPLEMLNLYVLPYWWVLRGTGVSVFLSGGFLPNSTEGRGCVAAGLTPARARVCQVACCPES